MRPSHRRRWSVMFTATLVACWAAAAGAAGGTRPAPVEVPRCCPAGLQLAEAALAQVAGEVSREQAAALCAPPAPGSPPAPWQPRVFAPARGAYLERGRLPAHWRAAFGALPACAALRVLPEHAAPYALLANNGSLLLRAPAALLAAGRYCADAAGALVCADDARAPASVCCAEGQAFDGARCVPDAAGAAAALAQLRAALAAAGAPAVAAVGRGWPACPAAAGPHYAEAGALAAGALDAAGALALGAATLPPGAWCVDARGGGGARVLACAAHSRAEGPAAHHALYGAGLALGALFLLATLAASLALPAAHHALHWRCQTHYVAALMLGDALLAVTQLAADALPPPLCRAIAVSMHFLFLSAFFWLNTMCFNIWWTFRDFRPTVLERGQEAWRLRVYALYAWGGPLALAGAAALLDCWGAGAGAAGVLRPRFGERRCWFYGDAEVLAYFFGPVGVLLAVNVALFASTARQLTCGLWRRDELKASTERAALGRVCAKLVVVMGVPWALDVLSWAVGGPAYLWYATDMLNALQGLLIFLVVGRQPHAWAALTALGRRALRCCCGGRTGLDGGGGGGGGSELRGRGAGSSHAPSCGDSLTHTTPAPEASASASAKPPMETVC